MFNLVSASCETDKVSGAAMTSESVSLNTEVTKYVSPSALYA